MDPLITKRGEDDLARALDDLGRREKDERREGDALEDAPGLNQVERVLEDVWAEERKRKQGRRWPFLLGALAAAAVLFFLFRSSVQTPTEGPTGEMLNDGVFRIHHPESFEGGWPKRITWGGPEGIAYRVSVVEELEEEEERILLPEQSVSGFQCPLSDEETRTWPKSVTIRVEYRTKDGRGVSTFDSWVLPR